MAAALVTAVASACGLGDPPTATPPLGPTSTTAGAVRPRGFDDTAVRVVLADGRELRWCVWLADTPAGRARGLMEVTDLDGRQGMLFRFDERGQGAFYMLRTRMPLALAWFDAGRFVGATTMAPCPDDDDDPRCPRHEPPAPYTEALELPAGSAEAALLGPGTTLEPAGPCA